MIDASQIMPLNFFMYKGVYSGEHHGMRYRKKKRAKNLMKFSRHMCGRSHTALQQHPKKK